MAFAELFTLSKERQKMFFCCLEKLVAEQQEEDARLKAPEQDLINGNTSVSTSNTAISKETAQDHINCQDKSGPAMTMPDSANLNAKSPDRIDVNKKSTIPPKKRCDIL